MSSVVVDPLTSPPEVPVSRLDRFFEITARGSSVGNEIRGGLATFFTMAYIVVLNPLILGSVKDGTGAFIGGGDQAQAMLLVAAGTALVAGLMTILMGLYGKFPVALAAGLGLNAYVAFGIASLPGMTWAAAMGLVVIEGFVVLLLVLTKFRLKVLQALPVELKLATGAGIGLFIMFIGLFDSGVVTAAKAVPVQLGQGGSIMTIPILVFLLTLIAMIVLEVRKVRGAILYSIIGGTVLAVVLESVLHVGSKVANPSGWGLNVPTWPTSVFGTPDFSAIGNFSLVEAFGTIGVASVLAIILALIMVDFFDTIGTLTAVGAEAGLLDETGNPPLVQRQLLVDSVAAMAGGAASVSSNTAYIESASGVGEGARTGLASVVTGLMFLLAMFLSPLVAIVPYEAATPALIVVGFLMLQQVLNIDLRNPEIGIPAVLTMVMMPFTYSIATGIGFGVISYLIIKAALGKFREVPPLLWVVGAVFVLYFILI